MAALRNGSKCSHTTCMLRFFTVSRLVLNPNLIFEIGSSYLKENLLWFYCTVRVVCKDTCLLYRDAVLLGRPNR